MVRKQIKLLDIATELNVSVGLVSLVLSGKGKENRISDAITQKVLAKASEMGYAVIAIDRDPQACGFAFTDEKIKSKKSENSFIK